jgi:hypothetical protein
MDRCVVGQTKDARISIEVLVQRELEDGRATVASNKDRPSEEEGPDSVPPLAILRNYLLTIGEPVIIPVKYCSRIVHAKDVHILDFEPGCFKVLYHPP